ncbi:DUF3347 domain-containing protein [Salegentibacter chungangensis]|uniref:DUF3347 domain-containing protein n=1 Tax=Salegentibacter chungangensis TaxID=1335724 RepID=A0ABW3NKG5_9FLAO
MKKIRRNALFVALMAGSLSLTACGENKEKKEAAAEPMQHEMHEGEMKEDMSSEMQAYKEQETTAEFKDETVAKVYKQYLEIKDALVNTNAEEAKAAAEGLASSLEEAGKEEALAAAKNIAESDDVNKQREAFSKLTASMEGVLKGALKSGEIYKQFCPMAFEGKGDYWYSNSKDIYNPYYGEKMLKCGRVDATIK